MDELGIDLQVLYPTVFLKPLTRRHEVERALCQSYNRWLGDIWREGKGRLRWAAVLPLSSMDDAIDELGAARNQGACAVFVNGIEHDRTLIDPYFFPLYAAASDLNVPICIHAGNNSFAWQDLFGRESGYSRAKLPVISAFHGLLSARIPARVPRLRLGFIEAAAQWVPAALHDLARRADVRWGETFDRFTALRDNRLFVACQMDDDLPYVLKYAGEDNLVIGTDYGHAHVATDLDALRRLRAHRELSRAVVAKIIDDNARALYGLARPAGEPGAGPPLDAFARPLR
jgi:predicted TIM-barrel fold metal-dependent hydrolase